MDRSAQIRSSKDQGTWAILIIGVVFNELAGGDSFADIVDRYPAANRLVEGVTGESEGIGGELGPNLINGRHRQKEYRPKALLFKQIVMSVGAIQI